MISDERSAKEHKGKKAEQRHWLQRDSDLTSFQLALGEVEEAD
jgi:hypothetical protein